VPEFLLRRVQLAQNIGLPDVIRAVNDSIEQLVRIGTENWWRSYPQVDATIIANMTQIVWLPQEDYVVESIIVRASSGTASLTPRINGVAMGVAGGTPIAVTATATRYAVTSANEAGLLDTVDMVVSGLVATHVSVSLGVRRRG
jgi:hypothetical protein